MVMTIQGHFRSRFWTFVVLALWLVCAAAETEVKWTPNPDDDVGPLPLSQRQREQLLQLEQIIQQSPNPQDTLQQAAAANQMSAEDLLSLLERNRSELQAVGGMPRGRSRNVWKLLSSSGLVVAQSARKHPRAFTVLASILMLLVFVATTAPRTGMVLSSRRSLLSSGPTTMWSPPVPYIQRAYLDRDSRLWRKEQFPEVKAMWDELLPADCDDGSVWHTKIRQSQKTLVQAASSQVTLSFADFSDDEELADEVLELLMEHAADVMSARQLTELVSGLRLIMEPSKKKKGVLVVEGIGDFGRYGLLPLFVVSQGDHDDELDVILSTAQKGSSHFDGQIRVGIERRDGQVRIRVHLAVPRKGRKTSRVAALKIVNGFAESMSASIRNRTKQSLARQQQSNRFEGRARARATERRQTRFQKAKELEEMAEDRRRRWQRQNPNSGHYRPSGDRMKSPNNAMY